MALVRALTPTVTVDDPPHEYRFPSATVEEAGRAATLFVKEAGTVDWLRAETRPDDVFYDIGANIGIYSVFVGARLGPLGSVYAFEPHAANVVALLRNFKANGLESIATVISAALDADERWGDFNYNVTTGGSSGSQFGTVHDDRERPFEPAFRELKFATAIDVLVGREAIRPPKLVKIDVDGNELLVLQGMRRVLMAPQPPRAVQVEVNQRHRQDLVSFMSSVGFAFDARHDTMAGKRRIAAGEDAARIAHNAIFRPTSDR